MVDRMTQWAERPNCAITVADRDCRIIFMNEPAREVYRKHGDLIGHDLLACHSARSQEIIRRILAEGGTNAYTITKNGHQKVIYQTAYRDAEGNVAGIMEISMPVADQMPHYDRDQPTRKES